MTYLLEYGYAQSGIFPEGGGLNDQFEKDLVAFSIIAEEKKLLEKSHGQRR